MSDTPKLPMQPIAVADDGVIRFVPNRIVADLLDFASPRGMSLNEIARRNYSIAEQEQFAQLIGYSIGGYSELSYVTDKSYRAAERIAEKLCAGLGERTPDTPETR
jgi:hypothetical protein